MTSWGFFSQPPRAPREKWKAGAAPSHRNKLQPQKCLQRSSYLGELGKQSLQVPRAAAVSLPEHGRHRYPSITTNSGNIFKSRRPLRAKVISSSLQPWRSQQPAPTLKEPGGDVSPSPAAGEGTDPHQHVLVPSVLHRCNITDRATGLSNKQFQRNWLWYHSSVTVGSLLTQI